jgi:hypothetical protein
VLAKREVSDMSITSDFTADRIDDFGRRAEHLRMDALTEFYDDGHPLANANFRLALVALEQAMVFFSMAAYYQGLPIDNQKGPC